MNLIARLRSFLRSAFLRSRMEREMDIELQFHVDSRIDDLIAHGVAREAAARQAREEFGDVLRWKEYAREFRGLRLLDEWTSDVRYGIRHLRRSPAFAAAAVLSMAIGIGANAAVFSLVNTIIFKTLPVRDPEQLVLVARVANSGINHSFPVPYYEQLASSNVLAGAVATSGMPGSVEIDGQAESVIGELVTGNYFDVLGIQPHLGRLFNSEDDRIEGGHPVAVISHRFWQRRFRANPDVVGRTILVNGQSITIIGVTPRRFHGLEPERSPDVRVPMRMQALMDGSRSRILSRGDWWVNVTARLKPGVRREQVLQQLNPGFEQYLRSLNSNPDRRLILQDGAAGRSPLREQFAQSLIALAVLAGFVLLFVCVNIANLMLARASARRAETSMRYALGAGAFRIARQLLIEVTLIALFAGVASLMVASRAARELLGMVTGPDSVLDVTLDFRVVAFSMSLAILAAVLSGIAPALYSARTNLADSLKGSRQPAGDRASGRRALVAVQIALSLILLVGAGLFVRTLVNLRTTGFGFEKDNLILLNLDPRLTGFSSDAIRRFYDDTQTQLSAAPEVRSAAFAFMPLLGESGWGSGLTLDNGVHHDNPGPLRNAVGAGYFKTIGTVMREGREFTEADTDTSEPVAVVNESFARTYFGRAPALGRRIGQGGPGGVATYTIVGVAQDGKGVGVRESVGPVWYIPYKQLPRFSRLTLHVRTVGDPERAIASVKQTIASIDKRVVVSGERTMEQQIERQVRAERLMASLGTFLGVVGVLLASLGLYGVLTYVTSVRMREFGIMVALGADTRWLVRTVMGQALRVIATGVAAGFIVVLALVEYLRSLLFGVEPMDALTFVVAIVIVAGLTAIAAYLPARRASLVDPVEALRL